MAADRTRGRFFRKPVIRPYKSRKGPDEAWTDMKEAANRIGLIVLVRTRLRVERLVPPEQDVERRQHQKGEDGR